VELAKTVTAATCKECHEKQYDEFASSKHAFAWAAMKAMPTSPARMPGWGDWKSVAANAATESTVKAVIDIVRSFLSPPRTVGEHSGYHDLVVFYSLPPLKGSLHSPIGGGRLPGGRGHVWASSPWEAH